MGDGSARVLASARGLLATALEIAQTRLELLGCELEQEKSNLFAALWWGALAVVVSGVALVLTISFVLLLLQEPYRLPALGGFAVLAIAACWAMLRHARQRLHSVGGAFAASAGELARDRAELAAPKG